MIDTGSETNYLYKRLSFYNRINELIQIKQHNETNVAIMRNNGPVFKCGADGEYR